MRHDHLLRSGGKEEWRLGGELWRKFESINVLSGLEPVRKYIIRIMCNFGGTTMIDRNRFRQH